MRNRIRMLILTLVTLAALLPAAAYADTGAADAPASATAAPAATQPPAAAPIDANGPTQKQMWVWLIIVAGVYIIFKSQSKQR